MLVATSLLAIGSIGLLRGLQGDDVATDAAPQATVSTKTVSYHKEIRPIFQANCQGCHQPAQPGGGYVMTTFESLLKGGESESAAIVPGKPDDSYLVEEITPTDGKAEMPKGKTPLHENDVALIRK